MDEKPANQLTPKNGSSAHKGIPLIRVLELRKKGLSTTDIAKILDCSPETIAYHLKPFLTGIDYLPAIREHRADLFTVVGHGLVESIGEDVIKDASLLQRVTAMGILYDKERLERGQSTSNVSVADYTAKLVDLRTERERLEAALGGPITDESEVLDV